MSDRVTYWDVLRGNANFRKLWLAQLTSNAGDWFNDVAVLGLILQLTGSPAAAGGFIIAAQVPGVLLSPVAGIWADRYDRKKVMVVSDLLRMALALGFLLVRSVDHIWLIYVITAALRSVTAFFGPAQRAAIPNLVTPRELLPANALSEVTWGAMLAVGAALGGLVSAYLGRDAAFIINSMSFLVSALLIWAIRARFSEATPHSLGQVSLGWKAMWGGLDYARHNLAVAAFIFVKFGWGLGAGTVLMLSLFATQVFYRGDDGIGWLYAARGFGVLLGPWLASLVVGASIARLRWSVSVGYLTSGLGYLGFSQAQSLPQAAAMVFFAHTGSGAAWVTSSTMLQQIVPDRLRGRVFSLDNALVTLAMALSTAFVGWAAPIYGPRAVCAWVASIALVCAAFWSGLILMRGAEIGVTSSIELEASGE